MTPTDVDRHSFRDLRIMFEAAEEREKEKWRHTMYAMQNLRDVAAATMGGKAQGTDFMFKQAFGSTRRSRHKWESLEEYREWLKEADAKVKAKHAKRRRRRGNDS